MTETLSDKQKLNNQRKTKAYFETSLGKNITPEELAECELSLYYLGRAIYKFNLQKQGVQNE